MLSKGPDATVNWEPLLSLQCSQLKPEGTLGLPLLSTLERGRNGARCWLCDVCRSLTGSVGAAVLCMICVIAPGNRNCLAKVTDGVRSRWHSAVAEAQEALSSGAVFIVIKCRSRHQQSSTQYYTTVIQQVLQSSLSGFFMMTGNENSFLYLVRVCTWD